MKLRIRMKCDRCGGRKVFSIWDSTGRVDQTCSACGGTGEMVVIQDRPMWLEIEEICNDAMSIDDLAFDDPDDGRVEGKAFLEDIIREGAELNLELKKHEQEIEAEGADDGHDEHDAEQERRARQRAVADDLGWLSNELGRGKRGRHERDHEP